MTTKDSILCYHVGVEAVLATHLATLIVDLQKLWAWREEHTLLQCPSVISSMV